MKTTIQFAVSLVVAGSFNSVAIAADLGKAEDLIQQFSSQMRAGLATSSNNSLGAKVRDLYSKDGYLSLTGQAQESENSLVVLKGDKSNLRGFKVYHDSQLAFEYYTDGQGRLQSRQVPITKIYPDLDQKFPIHTNQFATLAVAHPVYSAMALRQAPHIGPYDNQDVTKLESKPGSPYVFYLNISAVMNGSTPLNGVTKENMYRAWQSIADQYSFLQLNVTTNRAVYDAAKAANLSRTGIINFINQDGRSYAPVGSFGTTAAGTLFRNPSSGFDYGYGIGMTGAHEVGHQMGMNHDGGGSGGEYFEGIAAYQWGPIMGNYWMGGSWANQLFTWSKGEYNTASNKEDDLAIMTTRENVPYVADDNVNGKALVIASDGSIDPRQNWGQIERNTDTDTFTFTLASAGSINLRIDPIEYLRQLDVDASIYNAAGAVVARSNLPVHRSAEFVNLSLPAGDYRLVLQGGAEGTPANGFSKYSSLGYYAIKGQLGGSIPDTTPVLTSGVPVSGLSIAQAAWKYYAIDVPTGATKISFSINGNNGDADLYALLSNKPSTSSYNCKSDGSSSVETCSLSNPAAGRYYLGIYGYSAVTNLSVTATVTK